LRYQRERRGCGCGQGGMVVVVAVVVVVVGHDIVLYCIAILYRETSKGQGTCLLVVWCTVEEAEEEDEKQAAKKNSKRSEVKNRISASRWSTATLCVKSHFSCFARRDIVGLRALLYYRRASSFYCTSMKLNCD
jgi:hypothetical protein